VVGLFMKIKERFPLLTGVAACLGFLDPTVAQDLTIHHSSIANVALHFPHLMPEDHLEIFGR